MSFQQVARYFQDQGLGDRVRVLEQSSATVELAAQALGCRPREIAKTLSFLLEEGPVLVVTAGDGKIDNKKYKGFFHQKARMIPGDQVEALVGHAPGGVCPFACREGVPVYLDVSLRRFEKVYPAAGDSHSAVELTPEELARYSRCAGWVDLCKDWQDQP